MMDWFKIAHFFEPKVRNTIKYRNWINKVQVYVEHQDKFGNECLKIFYIAYLNDSFNDLASSEKVQIEDCFKESAYYVFSLSNGSSKFSPDQHIRLMEFKSMYLAISSYLTLQLENNLESGTDLDIASLDDLPFLNYSEEFLSSLLTQFGKYNWHYRRSFEWDVRQFESLHSLSKRSYSHYKEHPGKYSVLESDLVYYLSIDSNEIRDLLLRNEVRIKVTGSKTIKQIKIHVSDLVQAVQLKILELRDSRIGASSNEWERLLSTLYEEYLPEELGRIVEEEKNGFINGLPVKSNDVGQLNDGRLVLVKRFFLDENNDLKLAYTNLKSNLQKGERTRTVDAQLLLNYLNNEQLRHYCEQNVVIRLKNFEKWFSKRKTKFKNQPFIIDLAVS